ncbi:MAG: (deoxy)nucleoside triphosphate pyrophosphohydrolase [Desulfobacterales bacterium]
MTENKLVTVTAAILEHNGKILIAQRKASDRLSGKWEFPGGKLEKGETPEGCLQRELREEFGIETSVGHFVAESIYHYDHIAIRLIAYAATLLGGRLEPIDHDDYRWVTISELDRYEFAAADVPVVNKLRKR